MITNDHDFLVSVLPYSVQSINVFYRIADIQVYTVSRIISASRSSPSEKSSSASNPIKAGSSDDPQVCSYLEFADPH
jgi:hypothetical protein